MLRVYSTIAGQHDLRLIALAGFVCLFAAYTGLDLVARARGAARGPALRWAAAAALALGLGLWTAHFVAALAYRPGLPLSFAPGPSALSCVLAVVLCWLGIVILLRLDAPLAGGGMIGAAIGAVHYALMAALRVPAAVQWDPAYVLASLALGVALAALAMRLQSPRPSLRRRAGATLLFVLAAAGVHFTAMAALALVPDPRIAIPEAAAPGPLAVAAAMVTLVFMLLAISGLIMHNRFAWRTAREAARLRQSEARLRRSERHLARAQTLAEMGSFEWNPETGRVTWSDNLYRICGVAKESFAVTRDSAMALVHPEDRGRLAEADRVWLAGGEAAACEYRILRPSGECRQLVAEHETIRDEAGAVVSLLGTVRDVTAAKAGEERRHARESQLRQAQHLEALGTLAGGIAHALNNSLVPVLALAKMTVRRLPEGSREQSNLLTILRAGEKARDLVGRIVAFSRQELPVHVPVDLAELTRHALLLLRASLPSTIVLEERIEAVPLLMGDPAQLSQIVINLVVNAAQAFPDHAGIVTVEVATASGERLPQVPDRTPGPAVRLSVLDRGCGMSKETLARVFEPFFTTKRVGEGTGLGLSTVHGIVTQHGGHITVESMIGRGTRFDVYLPAQAAAEGAASAVPGMAAA